MSEQPGEYENKAVQAEFGKRYTVSVEAEPPPVVETPMSPTMEAVQSDSGTVVASPPADYDG